MYQITLTDSTTTATLPALNVPLVEEPLEGAVDVKTLDQNIYTDFINQKRLWSNVWSYMSEADFAVIKGFYDRQFSLLLYPTITITELGVTGIVVRMTLSPRNVIDHCGTVENVQASFRETVQISGV